MSAFARATSPSVFNVRLLCSKGRKPLVYAYTPLNTTRSEYTAENLDREKKLVQRYYLRCTATEAPDCFLNRKGQGPHRRNVATTRRAHTEIKTTGWTPDLCRQRHSWMCQPACERFCCDRSSSIARRASASPPCVPRRLYRSRLGFVPDHRYVDRPKSPA